MRRLLLVPFLLLSVSCSAKVPAAPALQVASWELVRDQLPGGTLRVLHVANTQGRERMIVQGGGNDLLTLPVYAYLFDHPTEGPVLIDTGFGRRTAADPNDYPGRTATQALRVTMEEGAAVADRLPDVGYSVDDVRHIVVTHMHSDHIGGLEDFPRAALWVSRAEWEAAGEPGPLGKPDPRPYENHEIVKLVEFTATPSYGVFPGHVDLFGDGSLILLPAPGHTPGHTAVLLNLRGGSFLFTGDCAWTDRHWQGPELKGGLVRNLLEHDWEQNWDTQWRIHTWAKTQPEMTVVAGHEFANLERLKAWPEPYE